MSVFITEFKNGKTGPKGIATPVELQVKLVKICDSCETIEQRETFINWIQDLPENIVCFNFSNDLIERALYGRKKWI